MNKIQFALLTAFAAAAVNILTATPYRIDASGNFVFVGSNSLWPTLASGSPYAVSFIFDSNAIGSGTVDSKTYVSVGDTFQAYTSFGGFTFQTTGTRVSVSNFSGSDVLDVSINGPFDQGGYSFPSAGSILISLRSEPGLAFSSSELSNITDGLIISEFNAFAGFYITAIENGSSVLSFGYISTLAVTPVIPEPNSFSVIAGLLSMVVAAGRRRMIRSK